MVRVISQETYDETVKENIEELCMTPEEAVQDAIEQFAAQGVDLTLIIKDLALTDDSENIVYLLKKLSQYHENLPSDQDICGLLSKFKIQLEKGIAYKIYSGKNGAYEIMVNFITNLKNQPCLLKLALEAMIALMTDHPDILDEKGVSLQKSLLDECSDNAEILKLNLKWIKVCCIKHEMNRQKIFNNMNNKLKQLLNKDYNDLVIKETCALLRTLTLDDDIRHEFGKAHEHATGIAKDTIEPLTKLLSTFKHNKFVVIEVLSTLASIIVRNEFCQEFDEIGGIDRIIETLTNFPDEEKINYNALKLLKSLAGNDLVKAHIIKNGCAPLIIYALSRFRNSETVASVGLACIAALTLKNPTNATAFYECDAVLIIIECIKLSKKNPNIYQQAARAVRNMSVRNKESEEFIFHGLEELFRSVLKSFNDDVESDLKAALRDLGLDIELKERWTGKGGALTER